MAGSSDDNNSLALFCDFENIALGVRDAKYQKFDISHILEKLLVKGSIVVKKAYCDWARYKDFKVPMHEASFELIDIPHVRQSGKNSADIRMVVDALDLCYTKAHVNTFVIISGDSDFSPLVSKLRENAKTVIGVGVKNSTSDLLINNCDEFIYYDDLVRELERNLERKPANRKRAKKRAARSGKSKEESAANAEAADAASDADETSRDEETDQNSGAKSGSKNGRRKRTKAAGVSADASVESAADTDSDSTASSAAETSSEIATETATETTAGASVNTSPRSSADSSAETSDDSGDDASDASDESTAADDRKEELIQDGLDLLLGTASALSAERDGNDKLWGSMVKQTLKRRRPGFNESYYGFDSFGKMLEEAQSRGYLTLELDDRSGGYIIRKISG